MKYALVTGASRGLGYEISKDLHYEGWEVFGLSRTKSDLSIHHLSADLLDSLDVKEVVNTLKGRGNLNLLINCAGTVHRGTPGQISAEAIEETFKLNVQSHIQLTEGLLGTIRKNEGDIVFIGSSHVYAPMGNAGVYGASKFALEGYAESLRQALRETPVRVISINPGAFDLTDNPETMNTRDISKIVLDVLKLPKNTQVSEIRIDRKIIKS